MRGHYRIAAIFVGVYLFQLVVAGYWHFRPLASRDLGSSVSAELRKDVHVVHLVPLLGLPMMLGTQNYHVILRSGEQKKAIGIDIRQDLPVEELHASTQGGNVIISRGSGVEVARFSINDQAR